jgi:tRNA pseudouridine55 synthase
MSAIYDLNGALLINKQAGPTSNGVLSELKEILSSHFNLSKRRDLPTIGHTGTLDPFATGLLVILLGNASKLSRYFLHARKQYEGIMHFGETTLPGDPTDPISEQCATLPESLEKLNQRAGIFKSQAYLQTPPMHSAKKQNGRPLYELARQGIEVEREPKLCHIYDFEFESYTAPDAFFKVDCSSGTYVRTLAQDFARIMGSIGMLSTLKRTKVGPFGIEQSLTTAQFRDVLKSNEQQITELSCYVKFDRVLDHFSKVEISDQEVRDLTQGKQQSFLQMSARFPHEVKEVALFRNQSLIAIASRAYADHGYMPWALDRVFPQ